MSWLAKDFSCGISTDEVRCPARKGPKIGPEGGERVNVAICWEIEEGFPQREVSKD